MSIVPIVSSTSSLPVFSPPGSITPVQNNMVLSTVLPSDASVVDASSNGDVVVGRAGGSVDVYDAGGLKHRCSKSAARASTVAHAKIVPLPLDGPGELLVAARADGRIESYYLNGSRWQELKDIGRVEGTPLRVLGCEAGGVGVATKDRFTLFGWDGGGWRVEGIVAYGHVEGGGEVEKVAAIGKLLCLGEGWRGGEAAQPEKDRRTCEYDVQRRRDFACRCRFLV